MAITIKEVAKLAGVSPSTVSRTCNNNPKISEKTKEKVRKAMKELGYTPNFQASNLVTKNSKTIGVVLPIMEKNTYQNTFFLEVIHGLSQCCNNNGYMNTIISGNSNEELFETITSVVKSGKADGFILMYSKSNDPVVKYLEENRFPYAIIGKPASKENSTIYVDNDNITAGKDAASYLIKLGHDRIAFYYNKGHRVFVQDRKLGYISALNDNSIPFDEKLVIEEKTIAGNEEQFFKELFSLPNPPTAIIAIDDITALNLEKIFLEIGIKVPEDISIICFNNSIITRLTTPQLTCVDINNYQLGFQVCDQIIKHLQSPDVMANKIIVPHTIVERESCKKRGQ